MLQAGGRGAGGERWPWGCRSAAGTTTPTRLAVTMRRGSPCPPASSMTEALTECSKRFEGADVKLSFAGSDELAAQIRQGVEPDVFASANTKLPDALAAEGKLSKPVEFVSNTLVVAVPKDSEIESVEELTTSGTTVAMGSETVPIGSYTREVLGRLPGDARRSDPRQRALERAGREGHRRQADPGRGRRRLRLRSATSRRPTARCARSSCPASCSRASSTRRAWSRAPSSPSWPSDTSKGWSTATATRRSSATASAR